MQFTVTTAGAQFDRLGVMYLGDIEVFRTSTAEPNLIPGGIVWTFTKEMDQYNALWKAKQKIIFDLPNVVNQQYNGVLATTVTATFFSVANPRDTADLILPISTQESSKNKPSAFHYRGEKTSVGQKLPPNVKRAVVSLSACGQADEEFWYTNVLSGDMKTFGDDNALKGYSSFREVQLLIDGQLAGVTWPFPVMFTGAFSPGLWTPIAGIDAFDLRQHEIDITPWLPKLCDGKSHNFELKVVGLNDASARHGHDHSGARTGTLSSKVNHYWVLSGTIFVFVDKTQSAGSQTSGTPINVRALSPEISVSSSTTSKGGRKDSLTEEVHVDREISITSSIWTGKGATRSVSWRQKLTMDSRRQITNQGHSQVTSQNVTGADYGTSNYINTYNYPLTLTNAVISYAQGPPAVQASVDRGLDWTINGPSVFSSGIQSFSRANPSSFTPPGDAPLSGPSLPDMAGAILSTTQVANALFRGGRTVPGATMEQSFAFDGANWGGKMDTRMELYRRHLKAASGRINADDQTVLGQKYNPSFANRMAMVSDVSVSNVTMHLDVSATNGTTNGTQSDTTNVKLLLGYGPGQSKAEIDGVSL